MQNKFKLLIGTIFVSVSCKTAPPPPPVVIIQPAARENSLRIPEKFKSYTSGKYVDNAEQLNGSHKVHRVVDSARWNLAYTPRSAVSLAPGAVRVASSVSHNPQSYRHRISDLETKSKKQDEMLSNFASQDKTDEEIKTLKGEVEGLKKSLVAVNKTNEEFKKVSSKIDVLELKMKNKKPTVIGSAQWETVK